ncbi:unnamed protein product [Caretta caretta]
MYSTSTLELQFMRGGNGVNGDRQWSTRHRPHGQCLSQTVKRNFSSFALACDEIGLTISQKKIMIMAQDVLTTPEVSIAKS